MFTGIIEEMGRLVHIEQDRGNTHFKIEANMSSELKIDQSLAHDGCCLTVTNVDENTYEVTAIQETLSLYNFRKLETKYNDQFRALHEK